jgi:membrane glycosyltransferase
VRSLGLYTVPTETDPDEILVQADELRSFTASDNAARFRDLVLDPVLLAAKLEKLSSVQESQRGGLDKLVERALRMGPAAITDEERSRLMADADAMRTLHREAWRSWPVEHWAQGRETPQLPTDRVYTQSLPQAR